MPERELRVLAPMAGAFVAGTRAGALTASLLGADTRAGAGAGFFAGAGADTRAGAGAGLCAGADLLVRACAVGTAWGAALPRCVDLAACADALPERMLAAQNAKATRPAEREIR